MTLRKGRERDGCVFCWNWWNLWKLCFLYWERSNGKFQFYMFIITFQPSLSYGFLRSTVQVSNLEFSPYLTWNFCTIFHFNKSHSRITHSTWSSDYMGAFILFLNSVVHIIMYSYYFCAMFKSLEKFLKLVKPLITSLQIVSIKKNVEIFGWIVMDFYLQFSLHCDSTNRHSISHFRFN